jgi:exosortase/archaeosortase
MENSNFKPHTFNNNSITTVHDPETLLLFFEYLDVCKNWAYMTVFGFSFVIFNCCQHWEIK